MANDTERARSKGESSTKRRGNEPAHKDGDHIRQAKEWGGVESVQRQRHPRGQEERKVSRQILNLGKLCCGAKAARQSDSESAG